LTPYSLLLTPYSLLLTPYSLLPTPYSLPRELHNKKSHRMKTYGGFFEEVLYLKLTLRELCRSTCFM
ncbi:MAG TPA: hypothetical protein EYG71_00895, partial [Leucothrix sp.]|nr:hypothetical protein [Leucothrix sp.]